MTDHLGSVNSNNSPFDYASSPNPARSTGNRVADALIKNIQNQQILGNQALTDINKQANLHDLHDIPDIPDIPDPSLALRLTMEKKEGNFTPEPNSVLNQPILNPISIEATGLSSAELAPHQINKFANEAQIPQAWTEIRKEISPLHGKYLAERNPLADSVMGNKLSTLAALFFTPPLGFAALMKHKSSQEALQQISQKQVEFLVQAINGNESNPSGNLKQVLIKTAQALDSLNGLSLDTARQVAESGSLAAPALKLAIGLFKAVDKSDPSVTSSDKTISGTDIAAMKEFLHESIALLDRPVEEIKSKINSGSGVTALKVFVEAMSDTPAYTDGKYNNSPDPLEKLGVSKKQSDEVTGFLKNISMRVKNLFNAGADQAVKIVDENATAAQAKTKEALLKLAQSMSNSSEVQQVVNYAGNGLQQVAPLVSQITQNAAETLQGQLKSIGVAAQQMNRASNAHLN
jgi:hypothetical protein